MPDARWNGPFDAFLPGGRTVHVGDVVTVTDSQLASAHWQKVETDSPAAPLKATPAKTSEGETD